MTTACERFRGWPSNPLIGEEPEAQLASRARKRGLSIYVLDLNKGLRSG